MSTSPPGPARSIHTRSVGVLLMLSSTTACVDGSDPPPTSTERHAVLGDVPAPRPSALPSADAVPPPWVFPLFECVGPNADGGSSAVFGYFSQADQIVEVGPGPANHLEGLDPDRGQPVELVPGYHPSVFAVAFTDGPTLRWRLGEQVAIADLGGPPCPAETVEATIVAAEPAPPIEPARQRQPEPPPDLLGQGDPHARADQFLAWFGRATPDETATIDALFDAAGNDLALTGAFIELAELERGRDWVRSALALVILGELRNDPAWQYLREVAFRPLPTTGTEVEHGEILERTIAIQLAIKAIHGVGYWRTPHADDALLELMNAGQSEVLRCEAARTYRFHHDIDDLDRARGALRPDETYCLDLVDNAVSAADFDARLAAFQAAHPELAPQPPAQQ